MTTCYSYIRFSHPNQSAGDSFQRQVERAADWCRRRGLTLDSSLTLHDLGVSAFKGHNAAVGNFRTFLDAVKTGRVPPGSVLIVESFDRISRQGIDEGYDIVKSILKSGVKIVTLSPEREFDREATRSLSKGALEIQLILERAAEESERKSDRVGAAWSRKQRAAAEKTLVTRCLPSWLTLANGKPAVVPAKARTVRYLFELARAGYGARRIAQRLNAEGVPVLGRTRMRRQSVAAAGTGARAAGPVVWTEPTVLYILTSRTVLGEYQAHRGRGRQRERVGDPVAGYYPGVVSAADFHAVGKLLRARAPVARGRRGRHLNLLAGLLRVAGTDDHLSYRHTPRRGSTVIPVNVCARGAVWRSFSADVLEAAVVSKLRELKAADVFPAGGDAAKRVEAAAARTAELEGLIAVWTAKMETPELVDVVAAKLTELEVKRRAAAAELEEAQRDAASPASEGWGEFRSLAGLLASNPGDEVRERVRAALRRVVESIHCLFTPAGRVRLAAARVQFRDGGGHRDYLIVSEPARANASARRPGRWWVRSFAEAGVQGTLDLRRKDHAATLARELAALTPADLTDN
jgi:DNA invertase Pin-like site-specific DNA recombinase